MFNNKCSCGHHWLADLIMVLTWVAGVGFVWSTWSGNLFLGRTMDELFQHVIVFAILGMGMRKACKCCCNSSGCGQNGCGTCKIDGGMK
jgi:hypothetical protein